MEDYLSLKGEDNHSRTCTQELTVRSLFRNKQEIQGIKLSWRLLQKNQQLGRCYQKLFMETKHPQEVLILESYWGPIVLVKARSSLANTLLDIVCVQEHYSSIFSKGKMSENSIGDNQQHARNICCTNDREREIGSFLMFAPNNIKKNIKAYQKLPLWVHVKV